MKFTHKELVKYKGHEGFINFISEHYVTICTHESEKCEKLAEGSRCKMNQINLVVYKWEWDLITRQKDEL